MREVHTPPQRALLDRWIQMSDEALADANSQRLSDQTRASVAFHSGYMCALFLVGPDALKLDSEHPSQKVLRQAAKIANVDVGPGLLHLQRLLDDPVSMPRSHVMLAWAKEMRALVPSDRT